MNIDSTSLVNPGDALKRAEALREYSAQRAEQFYLNGKSSAVSALGQEQAKSGDAVSFSSRMQERLQSLGGRDGEASAGSGSKSQSLADLKSSSNSQDALVEANKMVKQLQEKLKDVQKKLQEAQAKLAEAQARVQGDKGAGSAGQASLAPAEATEGQPAQPEASQGISVEAGAGAGVAGSQAQAEVEAAQQEVASLTAQMQEIMQSLAAAMKEALAAAQGAGQQA